MFKDLSSDKAYHMNIISVIILLIIVLIFGVFVYYYSTKTMGSLDKITNVLAVLYLGFAIAGSILYSVYTHDSEDTNGLFKSAVKGVIMIIVSVLITMLIIHVKGNVVEYITKPVVTGTPGAKGDNKYLLADSTTTVVGDTTSPMKLTNTY
jgi:vacuolar-type H+-ATPase subunit I/STV1